jgi:uncharacterized protein GlcG (DUF336 family)
VTRLTLAQASAIVDKALEKGREMKFKPLAVVVLDDRGTVKAAKQEDGTSLQRFEISFGKAFGALGMGSSSRNLDRIATERPTFATSLMVAFHGRFIPGAGGVLIQDAAGEILGAVGISGDKADNDEICAFAGIEAAGLKHPP